MDISTLTSLISAFRAETRTDSITPDTLGQLLQKIVNKMEEENTPTKPFYHIECDSEDGKLYLKFNPELLTAGYVPYLLRWSKKRPRYRNMSDKTRRWYGPKMRGWHLFYNDKKMSLTSSGEVLIGKNVGTDKNPVWEYTEDKRWLFGDIRAQYVGAHPHRTLVGYKVGFGCRTHLVDTNHRFRFGIVFGPPLPTKGSNRSLNFSKCVTNVAEFYVNFKKDTTVTTEGQQYSFAYSI